MTYQYDLASEADFPGVARLLHFAFAGPLEGATEWLGKHGAPNVRVMRSGDAPPIAACSIVIPMGQHAGGRSVPMTGVAGVAVTPEARGRGLARDMMRALVREQAAKGVALSALYASTQSLYRQVGYEAAGSRFKGSIPVHRINVKGSGADVVELSQADQPAIARCYSDFTRESNGTLDRGDYAWGRMWKFRDQPFHAFGVRRGEELDGFVFLAQTRKPETGRHDLTIGDLCFRTPEAGRGLLAFIANFSTIGDDAVFFLPPWHPALLLLPLQTARIEHQEAWMVRVCDAGAALRARGYPADLHATLTLDVQDETIEANRGLWTLSLEGGRASVVRGGDRARAVRCSERGLAAMYMSYLTPREARVVGLAEGPEDSLTALGRALAGPRACMTDFF